MNRRELIKQIAILTGATLAGSEAFLSGCTSNEKVVTDLFTEKDILFFDEVAETIIPKTNTPGAKDAELGKFMAKYATDCYNEPELKVLKEGIAFLNQSAEQKYDNVFIRINDSQKKELLTSIDMDAKKYEAGKTDDKKTSHYFTLMKQMVLLGFFTSKPGVTQVLRYNPVPGKYHGCIDYKQGETSWA